MIVKNYLEERQIAIDWLLTQGLPALPVAPRQNPFEYPLIGYEEGRRFVRCEWVDNKLCPLPRFTGKNPSYLDAQGIPTPLAHASYQKCLPTSSDLETWFHNPNNGLMTMGGWQNMVWIDFDVKQFLDQDDCDRQIDKWMDEYPQMQNTFIERTHSGGWRFAVKVESMPDFTNIKLAEDGKQVGEALGNGRLTVLAPTIGPSGNAYDSIQRVVPIQVESLEAIGIYACSSKREKRLQSYHPRAYVSYDSSPGVGGIRLTDLISDRVKRLLNWTPTEGEYDDRSALLVGAARELYGCENEALKYGIPLAGNRADALIEQFGQRFNYDASRISRCLASVDPASCKPSITFQGGDTAFFEKLRRLDHDVYQRCCPDNIKAEISQARTVHRKPTMAHSR